MNNQKRKGLQYLYFIVQESQIFQKHVQFRQTFKRDLTLLKLYKTSKTRQEQKKKARQDTTKSTKHQHHTYFS